uniref:Plastid light harvesting protein n=1 Tax=Corethron hystrix TaxID=216773 RepID=A0A7S1B749_9STRA|mmetsp:Transcript_14581/g.32135  ORF Transcript_14581/g.32135 Transcript_14581/m.32135 type:complete len:192 (+) Transcript_14581:147-722(+)
MKFLAIISLAFSSAVAFVPGTLAPAHSARIIRMSDEALSEVEAPIEDEEIVPVPEGPTYTCVSKSSIMAEPNTLEFGGVWDPLGLADIGSDETLAWYRHAEVKHGRVAMAAFVGWWAVGAGLRLPGELSHGLDFASIPSKGIGAWDATPGWGKAQMLLFAGLIEFHDELFHSRRSENGHYLRGGTPGKVRQ